MIAGARRPVLYTGGGVINAGPRASALLREFAALTGAPVTSTLMGLGAFPASDDQWLGMLGMHGSFEANNVMHDCDVMVAIGSRFDDRVTGKLDAFSPGSRKIHIDIDASSISKNVRADIGIIGDAGSVLEDLIAVWKARSLSCDAGALAEWWRQHPHPRPSLAAPPPGCRAGARFPARSQTSANCRRIARALPDRLGLCVHQRRVPPCPRSQSASRDPPTRGAKNHWWHGRKAAHSLSAAWQVPRHGQAVLPAQRLHRAGGVH
jgi:hypothetical protein